MALTLNYLRYLRDVSRRIVIKGGFEKVFPGSKTSPSHLSLLSDQRDHAWWTMAEQIVKIPDRQFFLGLGCVAGRTTHRGRQKSIAGPVAFVQVELLADPIYGLKVKKETLTLNFDLIQHLLDSKAIPDEETRLADPDSVQRLDIFIERLTKTSSNLPLPDCIVGDPISKIDEAWTAFSAQFVDELQKVDRNLKIAVFGPATSKQGLQQLATEVGFRYTPTCFVFAARFPDQLSTYQALHQLIEQLEDNGIENPLLDRLLCNALGLPFNENEKEPPIEKETIRSAIKTLPLTLSDRQKDAIYQAWENETSYIEGPPGTGKSYTIAAMMLTALSMGKKVLLVSQKKAAIYVVRDKLSKLSGNQNPLMFISKDPAVKRDLRTHLEGINDKLVQNNSAVTLQDRTSHYLRLSDRVKHKRMRLLALRLQIKTRVKLQREHFEVNAAFLSTSNELRDAFGDEIETIPAVDATNKERWQRRLDQFDGFPDAPPVSTKQFLLLKSTAASAHRELGRPRDRLALTIPSDLPYYLYQVIECGGNLHESERKREAATAAAQINQLRKLYTSELRDLTKNQSELTALEAEICWREKLASGSLRKNATRFHAMLHNVNSNLIEGRMSQVNYTQLTDAFPLWAGLIRDLGSYLTFEPQLFDMVIVDESSQVNIAEVLPAFYRGKRVCVVGDTKQLGLDAAGLFSINRSFEEMVWNSHFQGSRVSFKDAEEQGAKLSKHSILDFITTNAQTPPPVTRLNEHFRSAPKSAEFTSKTFYESDLRLMTTVPERVSLPCFEAIHVDGVRAEKGKIVDAEVVRCMTLLEDLIRKETWRTDPRLRGHFSGGKCPSIGVLCFTSDQTLLIRQNIFALYESAIADYDLFCGTPEEFQGNERNIMIILPACDQNSVAATFYNNSRRMNVATSRAINYTYFIFGGIPANFGLMNAFLGHFKVASETTQEMLKAYYQWTLSEDRMESEFEKRVYGFAREFLSTEFREHDFRIFNQVPSCGKLLDFVVMNPSTRKAFAIEVDGPSHYGEVGLDYTEDHLERDEILKRAGWKILHIPYYRWYYRGWIADRFPKIFQPYSDSFKKELRQYCQMTFL